MTTKQRAYLRGLGNALDAVMQVGKEGLGENSIQTISDLLEARELIKVKVLKNSVLRAREVCEEVCSKCDAEPIQVIGNVFLIYRRSTKKDFKHIELP